MASFTLDLGALPVVGGVRFRVWAPTATAVAVEVPGGGGRKSRLQRDGEYFQGVVAATAGDDYWYWLDDTLRRPDPASRCQPDGVHGPSRIVDPLFPWQDAAWPGIDLDACLFYELHIGTFTPAGTFDAAIERLPYLCELGVTALEIMPVAQFPGERNWGYDGVYPFAPQQSYGGVAGLKRFVDACHRQGLAVFLDVVYNHLGPEGNYLYAFGPYFTDRYRTPWGDAINFDGPGSDAVRHYFVANACHWLREYHFDGLRLDAVHGIFDGSARHILAELAEAVHALAADLGRPAYVIAESDLNDPRLVMDPLQGGYGLDAQWCDDFHHALRTLLTGDRRGYFVDFGKFSHLVKSFREGFVLAGDYSSYRLRRHGRSSAELPPNRLLVFSSNHDQVGNRRRGERLSVQLALPQLQLAAATVLLSPYLPCSLSAHFFDINWHPVKKELENKILMPILGDQYGTILENGELLLAFAEGAFFLYYGDHKLPILPKSYRQILALGLEKLEEELFGSAPPFQELMSIITALKYLPPTTEQEPEQISERYREKEVVKRRLWTLYQESSTIRTFVDGNVAIFNGNRGEPRSFDRLDTLLREQVYRISHWRVATEEINYRRFFDINSLGAIRVEDTAVFARTHQLIFALVAGGQVSGLRIDHADGLQDPEDYIKRLQLGCFLSLYGAAAAPDAALRREYAEKVVADPLFKPFYILGEKILLKAEKLPEDWRVFGTTGYDFVNQVNGLFVDTAQARSFEKLYTRFMKHRIDFPHVAYETKKLVMQVAMSSEINTLGHYLNRISEQNRHTRDFTLNSLIKSIVEVIACFPVYRTYINSFAVAERDHQYIDAAINRAKRQNPAISTSVFDFIREVLLLRFPENLGVECQPSGSILSNAFSRSPARSWPRGSKIPPSICTIAWSRSMKWEAIRSVSA
jgi:malto-oligosyltrehalose trehalohydrolase